MKANELYQREVEMMSVEEVRYIHWELHGDGMPVSPGQMLVMKCDDPKCIAPDHMSLRFVTPGGHRPDWWHLASREEWNDFYEKGPDSSLDEEAASAWFRAMELRGDDPDCPHCGVQEERADA